MPDDDGDDDDGQTTSDDDGVGDGDGDDVSTMMRARDDMYGDWRDERDGRALATARARQA